VSRAAWLSSSKHFFIAALSRSTKSIVFEGNRERELDEVKHALDEQVFKRGSQLFGSSKLMGGNHATSDREFFENALRYSSEQQKIKAKEDEAFFQQVNTTFDHMLASAARTRPGTPTCPTSRNWRNGRSCETKA
jgi:hypothetical protein